MAEIRDPRQRRYPPGLRERAIQMVGEAAEKGGDRYGVIPQTELALEPGPP